MSNYSKTTNFATKDGLSSGDPLKVVKGAEIDTEFNNIATMSATKQDSLPLTDSTAIVFNSGDSTKKVRISAASVATGTTRVLTVQDLDGTIAILSQPATFTTIGGTVITASTSVVTPIVDSGSTGALAFKTNNGITGFQITHVASGVNFLGTSAQAAGAAAVFLFAQGADTNLGISLGTKGTQSHNFVTDVSGSALTQFQVLHTASATRNITVTGSNGGNPTISTTAGALALGNGQLQWPATQNPSADVNTLDDYEEGTWVPSVGGTATYTTQTGKYTKIGNLVYIFCLLQINVIGTGSTTVVSGLPFTSTADFTPMAVGNFSGSVTSVVSLSAVVNSSGTTATIRSLLAANTLDGANPIFGNGTILRFAGCYQAV